MFHRETRAELLVFTAQATRDLRRFSDITQRRSRMGRNSVEQTIHRKEER